MPVFIDTLSDFADTKRFGESFGSYPVLRIHNLKGQDIGGRINTNRTAGRVATKTLIQQFDSSLGRFKKAK